MGFSLRGFLDEATAQLNPFDNGKTASTVRATRFTDRPKPPPHNSGFTAKTRANDGFPFPDFKSSAPGQTLRADLSLMNRLPFTAKADIGFHMRSPSGRLINIPQSQEMMRGRENMYYGLEGQIPKDAASGDWRVWATLNNQEVPGSSQQHRVLSAQPIDRYSQPRIGKNPTLDYDSSYGRQSQLRIMLNRALDGF